MVWWKGVSWASRVEQVLCGLDAIRQGACTIGDRKFSCLSRGFR
ncbi:BQ5605_C001g00796 [Microbotryum silenes-dioicae]|uniref:BQ5605_C001g00796 protein n=1 Tax=Microbotryum silenes-dioicae TaxID=796604 RepID=A0A2X0P6W0_9BASI|nr:BQ5605_C001g00796 [Microbotryum silenes-dioicae]